jgi:putative transposase
LNAGDLLQTGEQSWQRFRQVALPKTRKVGQRELEETVGGVVFFTQKKDPPRARRRGHTEEQMLAALREAESGTTIAEVCREVGISEQTFYVWKRKYAGLGLSELRELRQLREENTKLKRLVADLSLDRHMLQEIVRKKL